MKWVQLALFLFITNAYAQFMAPSKVSPFTGESYQHVMISKTFLDDRWLKNYHWRYVTLYNEEVYKDRLYDLPDFEEYCHEAGDRVASWSFSRSFERTINSAVSFNVGVLGFEFGADFARSFQVEVTRWIQAIDGIAAIHTPMMRYKRLVGITYIQTFYPETNETINLQIDHPEFLVDKLEPAFTIKRVITEECL